ncbi:hotdog fold thioesterase [Chitinophaga nivalis]|uniref:Hotdog fold thioesterase n=1 Tax=Chitinophaga nivalis TaxID=2991709 RepID=A0ABT3IIW0_9BACT|nr:hotdog fold thioesterase [Chitinophaga nivalis]MCW3466448.1 hotdog fold thioesterase [Chitinophaga nivalis]MCW3483861.1 hotdog fold thioesterase [Chitinophaga nivalis]
MKSIWYSTDITLVQLNEESTATMNAHLGMEFTELGVDYLVARMPVDSRTVQKYGILHGGASVALAETVGSIASTLIIDPVQQLCVGMEINANHVRGVRSGFVHAKATPLHIGGKSHVWDIRITDDQQQLICVCRHTVVVLNKADHIVR